MKRIFIAVSAICFVCAVAIILVGARDGAMRQRNRMRTQPTYYQQRYYKMAP
jgi:hypothetical protein